MRMREGFRSPVREFRTPGSLAGLAGNCQSYATRAILAFKVLAPGMKPEAQFCKNICEGARKS